MTVSYTVTTPEYVAWAKKGERMSEPEEKVKEYHKSLVDREEGLEGAGIHGGQHRQGWQSVEMTLNLLGIKIEGVNT